MNILELVLDTIQQELKNFLLSYEAYLPDKSIEKIENIIYFAVDLQILTQEDEILDYQIGDDVLKKLQESKELIIREIRKNIIFN